jgi:formylglycine-generating enzyme required for sulfatase activity/serine/threonine protein kinase
MSPGNDPTQFISPDDMEGGMRGLAAGRRVFGRYRLEKIAGRGGMGIVWRARDEELERIVALKFLPPDVAADVEAVRDLKIETKRCLDLTHPQIVRVYDFVQGPAGAAIAMEFVEGESLAARKAGSPNGCLSVAEVSKFLGQLCAALDYAHFKVHLLHRDLKPANLLITRNGDLKVMDFGIACSLVETRTRLTADANRSTSGTPLYMSPQQLMGDRPSVSDDVYALGATLYELLTGKPPFYRGDGYALMMQVREKVPKPMAEQRADLQVVAEPIPPEWEKVILSCLAKDPKDRPGSAGEVAQRLGSAVERVAVAVESPVGSPEKSERSESTTVTVKKQNTAGNSRRLLLAAGLVVGLIAAGVGYYFLGRSSPSGEAPVVVVPIAAEPKQAAPAPIEGRGGAIVRTAPTGAEVTIGSLERGVSPLTLREAKPGKYPVRVRAAGYEDWSGAVEVKENDFAEIDIPLERSTGTLLVTSEPAGLEAELIGRLIPNGPPPTGTQTIKTPQKVKLPTGGYDIVFRRAGWPDQRRTAEVGRNQLVETAGDFAAGKVVISSDPAGARVMAAGATVGTTPVTLELPPGPLTVELRLPGYQAATLSGTVIARRESHLNAMLERPRPPAPGNPATLPELDLELKYIEAGIFVMGSPESEADRDSEEGPQTQVTLTQGFWIGKTEVTQGQYEAVMGANPSEFKAAGKNAPVETVSWLDAMEFCRKLTEHEQAEGRLPAGYVYTLPTEAQWEYACRAGTKTPYAGDLGQLAWFDKTGGKTTHPVGQKAANAWGLHDVHGNVWEWCLDDFADRLPGGSATDYAAPSKPGLRHAYRGGGWNNSPEDCRSAKRIEADGDDREKNVGFRLALSMPPAAATGSTEAKSSGSGFGAGVKSLLKVIKPGDTRTAPASSAGFLNVTINHAPPAPLRFTVVLTRVDGAMESLEFPVDEGSQGRTDKGALTTKLTVPPGTYKFTVKSGGFKDVSQVGPRFGIGRKKSQIEIEAGDESGLEFELEPAGKE